MKTFSFRHATLSDRDLVTFYEAAERQGVRIIDVPDSLNQITSYMFADRNAHPHVILRKDYVNGDYVLMCTTSYSVDETEAMKNPTLDKLLEALRPVPPESDLFNVSLPLPEVSTIYLVDGNFEMPFESREEAESFARFKRLVKDLNEDVRGLEGSAGQIIEWCIHNRKAFAELEEDMDVVKGYSLFKALVLDIDRAWDVGYEPAETAARWIYRNLARLDEISN